MDLKLLVILGIVFAVILVLVQDIPIALQPEGTLNANVSVICPFNLKLNSLPVYFLSSNIVLNYSLATTVQCPIPGINGNIYIWEANTTQINPLYSNSLHATNVSIIPQVYNITVNKDLFKPGKYWVNVSFSGPYYKEFTNSPQSFEAQSPANIIITNLSIRSPVKINSPVTIAENITNKGNISSSSNTILHIKILGPKGFSYEIKQLVGPISPAGTKSESISIPSAAPSIGTYSVHENVTYYSIYVINNITYSSALQIASIPYISYTVVRPASPPIVVKPKPPTTIANIKYLSTPILVSLVAGQSVVKSIEIRNNNTKPTWINFTIPNVTGFHISLSSKNVYLLPLQSQSVDVVIKALKNASIGSTIISIPEKVTELNGSPVSYTQYITCVVEKSTTSKPILLNSITSINSSKTIQGLVEVYNPTNKDIYNTSASISIPLIVANNVNDISIAGAPGHVSISNGAYVIEWSIPILPKNSPANLYYTVKNASNSEAFKNSPVSFTVPSQVSVSAIRVFNIGIPTFYANQSRYIRISALYTGTKVNNITFSLVGPPGISIINSSQTFKVAPNTVLSPRFKLIAGNSGTFLMTLYVSGSGISKNYTFDLIVLPQIKTTTTISPILITTTTAQKAIITPTYTDYGILAAIIITGVGAVLVGKYKKTNKSKYNASRAARLKDMKEHIKRGE